MRFAMAICLAATLVGCGPTEPPPCCGQAVEHRPDAAKHHFGVDKRPAPQAPLDIILPAPVVDAFTRMAGVAERVEVAAWWSAFASGMLCGVTGSLVLALLVVGARTK